MEKKRSIATEYITCSLDELVRNYGKIVTSLCRRMIRNPEDAEEAAQEVWIQVMKSLGSFKGESKFTTWLYTLTRRTVQRYLNREKLYSTAFLREFFHSHEDKGMQELEEIPVEDRSSWMKLQCDACLTGILHCLDNEARLIYLFRTLTRLEYQDLSVIFDRPEAAIRQIFSRSCRKVNAFLNDECLLYNPQGSCRCKMRDPIKYLENQGEYQKVRDLAGKMFFLQKADIYLNNLNFWEKHLSN